MARGGPSFSPKTKKNFYLNAEIDGRQTNVSAGPKDKDGGMFCRFYMLDKGEVVEAFRVVGTTHDPEGNLTYNIVFLIEPNFEDYDHGKILAISKER